MDNSFESYTIAGWRAVSHTSDAGNCSDHLSELGRATTVYHEAAPDRLESARLEYEEALRKFNATFRP